jgi:hypothetical protein
VLHKACHQAGLSSDGTELLRFGENAIYRLAADPRQAPPAPAPAKTEGGVRGS